MSEYSSPAFSRKVVAGLVIAVRHHPNGIRIRLADVDIGRLGKVQIVFGGPDIVRAGDLVPVALPGAHLPGRKKIRRTSFRGQTSQGMFCSSTELGWEVDGPDEVALLRPGDLVPGTSLECARWPDVRAELTAWHVEQRARWMRGRSGVQPPAL